MLALGRDDWDIAGAVTTKANEIALKRREAEITALAHAVGNRVAEVISKMF